MRFAVLLPLSLFAFLSCQSEAPREAASVRTAAAAPAVHAPEAPPFRGVTLDARRPPEPGTLERLQALGVTHLTLTSFGFQAASHLPEIRMHTDARWYSESDAGIRVLARRADSLGMRVILKPHIWVGHFSDGGQTLADVAFETEAAWRQWEAGYRTFLLHYARLAEEVGADMLVVGTELATVARTREAFWRALIAEIRTLYGGRLTYAANWYDEYEHVPFWDALDYVGIQAYFPLSDAANPTAEVLRAGWARHREAIAALQRRVGRPVLFTEIGYRSVSYAAAEPWRWPSREEVAPPDDALQARLYDAFFETIWHEPWFAGALIWKWYPVAAPHERHRLDFTPQFKPAEAVIARWFAATDAPSGTR